MDTDTWIDDSHPEGLREVHTLHLQADEHHSPVVNPAAPDECAYRYCGLAVTHNGKRHGFHA